MSKATIDSIRRILTIFKTSEAAIRPHFFIEGGLKEKAVKKTTFQKTLPMTLH